jgi:hypothetical protein
MSGTRRRKAQPERRRVVMPINPVPIKPPSFSTMESSASSDNSQGSYSSFFNSPHEISEPNLKYLELMRGTTEQPPNKNSNILKKIQKSLNAEIEKSKLQQKEIDELNFYKKINNLNSELTELCYNRSNLFLLWMIMSNENYDIFIKFYSDDKNRYSKDKAVFEKFKLLYNKLFIKSFPQFNTHYKELSSKIRTCRDNIFQEFIKIFPNCNKTFLKNQIIEYAHYKENITYTYLVDLKNNELKELNLNESVILYGLFLILDKPDDEGFKKERSLISDKIDANGFNDISIFGDIRNLLKKVTTDKGIHYIIDIISNNKLAIKRFEERCERQTAPVVQGVPIPSSPRNRSRKENNMKQKGPVVQRVPIPTPPTIPSPPRNPSRRPRQSRNRRITIRNTLLGQGTKI